MSASTPSTARLVLGGLKSLLPALPSTLGTGGSNNARYCHAVWLRHVRRAADAGAQLARGHVVEIGPGDSLGVSIAALLTGASRVTALDAIPHAASELNLTVARHLLDLIQNREPIPDQSEFPHLKPFVADLRFPTHALPHLPDVEALASILEATLPTLRALPGDLGAASPLRYLCPWRPDSIAASSADAIISQATMEYFDDLTAAYATLASWLTPGGVMSHQIDLSSHHLTPTWDGHWSISRPLWALIKGKRPFFPNRAPLSDHLRAIKRANLDLVALTRYEAPPTRPRSRLAPPFCRLSLDDRMTRGAWILAQKPR